MDNKTKWTTVKKCKFLDGEAVAIRAYDFEEWVCGILVTMSDGTKGIKTIDRHYPSTLDPRNQIRKQTWKTYTKVIHVREDGSEQDEPRVEVK